MDINKKLLNTRKPIKERRNDALPMANKEGDHAIWTDP